MGSEFGHVFEVYGQGFSMSGDFFQKLGDGGQEFTETNQRYYLKGAFAPTRSQVRTESGYFNLKTRSSHTGNWKNWRQRGPFGFS